MSLTEVVYFSAKWCGPCKQLAPVFYHVATQHAEKASFSEVDIDVDPDFAQRCGIMSVPTVMIFRGAQAVRRLTGSFTTRDLIAALDD